MKYKIDHDYHIHSCLSKCAKDLGLDTDTILSCAKRDSLSRICLTNHYWDSLVPLSFPWYREQNFEHISSAKPLPCDKDIEFSFGCETDMDLNFELGIPHQRYDDFSFIIVPTTHLHLIDFTISKEDSDSNLSRAKVWTERLEALLSKDLPFKKIGLAHLASPHINVKTRGDYLEILNFLRDDDMERIFTKAAKLGCGIELNKADMSFEECEADIVLRPFRIAKSCGCKFYLGSDAHSEQMFDKRVEVFERAIDLLELSESDKFYF